MWKEKYKEKMKIVSALLVLCYLVLSGMTLSKIGLTPMSHQDYSRSRDYGGVIRKDKALYTQVMGDIYDRNGFPILATDQAISQASFSYDRSYSHLLGNPYFRDYGLIGRYYDTLMDESSKDATPSKGTSLELTVDDQLQQYAYSLTQGSRAAVVVLKRHSGEVLALTSTYEEDFDLGSSPDQAVIETYNDAYEPIWQPEYLNNYCPGSCQKIVTAAMGSETGMDSFCIDDVGYVEYSGERIYNNDQAVYGEGLDEPAAFTVSANTYFAAMINEIGLTEVRELSSRMKLNAYYQTDFGEVHNSFADGWRMRDMDRYRFGLLGIGQESSLSAVGLAMVIQMCIDNEMYLPHVVKNTCRGDKDGILHTVDVIREEKITSSVLKDSSCERVRELMETAAHSPGYALSGNILGAKSGTAEIAMEDTFTNRATLAAYNEDCIVVVSRIEAGAYGIDNKDTVERLFDYMTLYDEK